MNCKSQGFDKSLLVRRYSMKARALLIVIKFCLIIDSSANSFLAMFIEQLSRFAEYEINDYFTNIIIITSDTIDVSHSCSFIVDSYRNRFDHIDSLILLLLRGEIS
jgi:hypothetical protein